MKQTSQDRHLQAGWGGIEVRPNSLTMLRASLLHRPHSLATPSWARRSLKLPQPLLQVSRIWLSVTCLQMHTYMG